MFQWLKHNWGWLICIALVCIICILNFIPNDIVSISTRFETTAKRYILLEKGELVKLVQLENEGVAFYLQGDLLKVVYLSKNGWAHWHIAGKSYEWLGSLGRSSLGPTEGKIGSKSISFKELPWLFYRVYDGDWSGSGAVPKGMTPEIVQFTDQENQKYTLMYYVQRSDENVQVISAEQRDNESTAVFGSMLDDKQLFPRNISIPSPKVKTLRYLDTNEQIDLQIAIDYPRFFRGNVHEQTMNFTLLEQTIERFQSSGIKNADLFFRSVFVITEIDTRCDSFIFAEEWREQGMACRAITFQSGMNVVLCLADFISYDELLKIAQSGEMEVLHGDASFFKEFSYADLVKMHFSQPDDITDQFFISDGKLGLIISIDQSAGAYAILRTKNPVPFRGRASGEQN